MRIVSQDNDLDFPYENIAISTGFRGDKKEFYVYAHMLNCYEMGMRPQKLAIYSTKSKAKKAMEMLHRAYTGMPVVFQNVELGDDVKKMFADFRKNGIILHSFEDTESKVEHIDNVIFQFPQDEDVEV